MVVVTVIELLSSSNKAGEGRVDYLSRLRPSDRLYSPCFATTFGGRSCVGYWRNTRLGQPIAVVPTSLGTLCEIQDIFRVDPSRTIPSLGALPQTSSLT